MSRPRAGVALLAHGGGPTPVLNASLAGVVEEARKHDEISGLYGAVHGLQGVLEEHFVDLFAQSEEMLNRIAATSSPRCRARFRRDPRM
ncbi:MAG: hypothetical protein LAQ30_15865, partial [Acidobacteriia bacterium]|nr:hypothetical protein [Terriglobia bacterium]